MANWDLLSCASHLFLRFGFTAGAAAKAAELVDGHTGPILAVGAGTGISLQPFRSLGQLIAVDSSRRMAAICRKNGIHCLVADARDLPFSARTFGLVVLVSGVLDCVDDNGASEILKECERVLASSGSILASHIDHTLDRDFLVAHDLIKDSLILTSKKVSLWRQLREPSIQPTDDHRLLQLCRFYDALQEASESVGLPPHATIDALPEFHAYRNPTHLIELLGRSRLEAVDTLTDETSRVFAILARSSAPCVP